LDQRIGDACPDIILSIIGYPHCISDWSVRLALGKARFRAEGSVLAAPHYWIIADSQSFEMAWRVEAAEIIFLCFITDSYKVFN
jgi:hypothetical protein